MTDTVLVFEAASGLRVVLAIGLVGAVLVLTWMGLRGQVSRARRALLIGLRALAVVLLAVLFLEPALQERLLRPVQRRVVLAVDSSQSMALPGGDGRSRLDQAASFLADQRDALGALAQRFAFEAVEFDAESRPAAMGRLARRADGRRTDLGALLGQLAAEAGDDLAGVILVSDGADTQGLADLDAGQAWPGQLADILEAFPAPINTVAVGADGTFKDLSIERLAADDFAFIRNAVEVEVELRATGFEALTVPVLLEQGGRNLASTTVRLLPGAPQRVRLKFVPDRVGKFVYRVSVPVLPGESLPHNNSRTFVTRIIRDKIRVLHLVGRPSWDERFLRQELRRNPNIDLISFFILRTTTDAPGVRQDELSLIPFPVAELFGTELPTFDVVIFQNFNHGPYQVTLFLPQLAEYVSEGGAFLMVGGDLSFGSGGYAGTPLEEVLPVELASGPDVRIQEFRAVAAAAGGDHPVLDLGEGVSLDRLPPLGAFNQAQGLKPGAIVLLEHPFERAGSGRAPILALRDVGRGRSAALLTDGAWRWNFVHAGQGGTPRTYHRLINNLLRWLIRDPGLQAVSLRAGRASYLPDEPVRLVARLRGRSGPVEAWLEILDAAQDKVLERRAVELDAGGRAEVELERLPAGAYLARLEVRSQGQQVGRGEDAFVVSGAGREQARPRPRPELLARIAQSTGGRAIRAADGDVADLEFDPRDRYRVEASTSKPLLGRWWALLGLVALLVVEWFLRRRWGFA